jgi:hypothetical protein
MTLQTFADVRQLTHDQQTLCDWRDDLVSRLRRAELCFQTIGLSEERRAELIHEAEAFKRVCRAVGAEVLSDAREAERRAA